MGVSLMSVFIVSVQISSFDPTQSPSGTENLSNGNLTSIRQKTAGMSHDMTIKNIFYLRLKMVVSDCSRRSAECPFHFKYCENRQLSEQEIKRYQQIASLTSQVEEVSRL